MNIKKSGRFTQYILASQYVRLGLKLFNKLKGLFSVQQVHPYGGRTKNVNDKIMLSLVRCKIVNVLLIHVGKLKTDSLRKSL